MSDVKELRLVLTVTEAPDGTQLTLFTPLE